MRGPGVRQHVAHLEPGVPGRREACLRAAQPVERLGVAVGLDRGLRPGDGRLARRPDRAAALPRELQRVDPEPLGEPLECGRRRPRLAQLDLTDVLLREPLAGQLRLGQARLDPPRTHALADRGRPLDPGRTRPRCDNGSLLHALSLAHQKQLDQHWKRYPPQGGEKGSNKRDLSSEVARKQILDFTLFGYLTMVDSQGSVRGTTRRRHERETQGAGDNKPAGGGTGKV